MFVHVPTVVLEVYLTLDWWENNILIYEYTAFLVLC